MISFAEKKHIGLQKPWKIQGSASFLTGCCFGDFHPISHVKIFLFSSSNWNKPFNSNGWKIQVPGLKHNPSCYLRCARLPKTSWGPNGHSDRDPVAEEVLSLGLKSWIIWQLNLSQWWCEDPKFLCSFFSFFVGGNYLFTLCSIYLPFLGTWGFTPYLHLGFRGTSNIQLGESNRSFHEWCGSKSRWVANKVSAGALPRWGSWYWIISFGFVGSWAGRGSFM